MPTSKDKTIYANKYLHYQENRGILRKIVRQFYLNKIASYCLGNSVDIGCGNGTLLQILDKNSVGFEVNKEAVEFCRRKKLIVFEIPEKNPWKTIRNHLPRNCQTIIMNHVLEHIENPAIYFNQLLSFAVNEGIKRIVLVSPGKKGFLSDKTHISFITSNWFKKHKFIERYSLKIVKNLFFPVNSYKFGQLFTHNEWHLVADLPIQKR
ncbi:MAG: methyltransferase domain-containing protein [Candidatus Rifleibacteriota bacterium]